MNGMAHRNRIVLSALLLLLSAQIIFGIYGYANLSNTRASSENFKKNYMISQLEYNALSAFKQVDTYAAHLKTREFTSFSSRFLSLGTTAEAEKALREQNEKINRLQINADLLQAVYILGADSKQWNYVQYFDGEAQDVSELPWIEDLNGSGVMEALAVKGTGIPIYIQEGELQKVIRQKWSYVSDQQLQRVSAFVRGLEGKWIISNGVNDYTLGLLVLNDDFPQQLLYESDLVGYRLSIYTDSGIGTWGTGSLSLDLTGRNPSQEERASWARQAGEGGQIHYIKQLSPYGVVLVLTDTMTGWGADFSHTMMVMGVLFFLLLIGNFILSLSLANSILSPLLKLTRFIRNQGGLLPLEAFPRTKAAGKLLTTTSVRTKLLVLFLLTVLAPLLCMVVLFSMMQNQYAKQEWKGTVEAVSKQMSWTVSKQAEVYEGAANSLSVNDLLNGYLSSPTSNLPSTVSSFQSNIATTIYPESKDIAYFVLYDTNGNARYSTLFSNNLSLFYLDPQTYESEGVSEISWLPATPDIFNHLAIQLIKRVYRIDPDGQGEIVGYLQLVLKPDSFQSVVVQGNLSFQIVDEQGNPMYKRDGYEDRDMFSEAVNRTSNAASNSLVLEEKIPGLNWKMTVQFPLDSLHNRNGELLWVVASVALLCFMIGLILSHWLVRPIGELQNAMDQVDENKIEFAAKGMTRDEVSLLAHHFNRMVEKINQLVEEDFRSKLREKELNALKTQAEMSMLQQQINPHFLYNTLESINMEAQRNNGSMVSKMIGSLASLFRYSISSGPEQGVSLETEIEYTRYYVTIQEIRFRERFTVEWQINSETLHSKVLKFILQPIVENAINHGLSEYASGGELVISSQLENGRLMIRISDNGIGMRKTELEVLEHKLHEGLNEERPPSSSSIHHGVGLSNVNRRLKIYYGEEAELIIDSKYMKGTTVTLVIPINVKEGHD